jgi:S-ribosylhomocysteine lyase LuxS involved in autoinducer biosynthesis
MSALLEQLQLLTGQASNMGKFFDESINVKNFEKGPIGVSQINELLLTAGFDRMTEDYFSLLCNGQPIIYKDGLRIDGIGDLTQKVTAIRKLAALKYGNFKFAFKKWSLMNSEELADELSELLPPRPNYYETRTEPLEDIDFIDINDTYLLGEITGIRNNEDKEVAIRQKNAMVKGESNFRKYLTFDHMDVYVATSMRKKKDYISVGTFIKEVFSDPRIKPLKIRYFDPTQSYSKSRFCKGLIECLVLKRAKCSIYCVQESDTFGKDSELAITLAQGKPVLAWVPKIDDTDVHSARLIGDSVAENKDRPVVALRAYYFSLFPEHAAKNPNLAQADSIETLASEVARLLKDRFDDRAKILKEIHPLSLQVDINTGVAHGVIVVRTADECADILHKVLHRQLEFEFEEIKPEYDEFACGDYTKTYVLREKQTGSPYRIVVGDELLTNAFWNFYFDEQ